MYSKLEVAQVERDQEVIRQQDSTQWCVEFAALCVGTSGDIAHELARVSMRLGQYKTLYEQEVPPE